MISMQERYLTCHLCHHKAMPLGRFQHRFKSNRVLGRCRQRVTSIASMNDVVDVDKSDPEVIILDSPGACKPANKATETRGTVLPCCVIDLDDEDENIGCKTQSCFSGSVAGACQPMCCCTRCRNGSSSSAAVAQKAMHDCFRSTFGSSAAGTHQSKRVPVRGKHGLGNASDSEDSQSLDSNNSDASTVDLGSSESETSDCEIIEDVNGSIREQWERAASLRRMAASPISFNSDNPASTSESTCEDEAHFSGLRENQYSNEQQLNGIAEDLYGNAPPEFEAGLDSATSPSGVMPCRGNPSDRCALNTSFDDIDVHEDPTILVGHNTSSGQDKHLDSNVELGEYPAMNVDLLFQEKSSHCHQFMQNSIGHGVDIVEKINPDADANYNTTMARSSPECSSGRASSDQFGHGSAEENICSLDLNAPTVANSEVQDDLICAREKHKESSEYRRAAEEEWAARQRQLQIQAEEAQKLRRKRKAEIVRLLDMEKKQKERVEEIREAQRKNEETRDLKERLRVEVRQELDMIERRHGDMASLLRALGIDVAGGSLPLTSEIKASFKRALLRFHPDRVSSSNIHQQVKAEETFKFILRLKEKLLPAA